MEIEKDARSVSREGLDELFQQHADGAFRLAYLLTGDRGVAEDLVQDAFVRLCGRFAHIRRREAFGSYLRQTVVNLCRGHHRRRYVERLFTQRSRAGKRHDQIPDVEARSELMDALASLPERQRAAVVLRHYTDLSERQVAEILDCSVGNVKSLTSRGLSSLRARLEVTDVG